jgi:hypothetical protein
MTEEQMEELRNDVAWEEYLDLKDMNSNYEFDEPQED